MTVEEIGAISRGQADTVAGEQILAGGVGLGNRAIGDRVDEETFSADDVDTEVLAVAARSMPGIGV